MTELGTAEPQATADSVLSEMVGAMTLARAFEDETEAAELLRASREALKRRLGLEPIPAAH